MSKQQWQPQRDAYTCALCGRIDMMSERECVDSEWNPGVWDTERNIEVGVVCPEHEVIYNEEHAGYELATMRQILRIR